jgi:apolipoprotein N-acyltransferase
MKFLGLSLLAGLVSALGFAPLGLWPLTLLGFALLVWLVETAPRLRSALARGWWFGVGQFVLGLNWIATAFTYQAAMPAWLGWLAVVLLSLYLAIYPAAAAGLAWRWHKGSRILLILLLAAAWIVTEWMRATLFTGFAWNPVGVVLIDSWAKWLSRFIGTYGLSGFVVLASGLAYWLFRRPGWVRFPVIAAIAVLLMIDLNLVRRAEQAQSETRPLLRIVQPNIGQQNKWDPGYRRENFLRLARLSGHPSTTPRLLLWPEASIPDLLSIQPAARHRLAGLIGERDLMLLGAAEYVFGDDGMASAAYNSVFVLTPDGRLGERYDKAHLVPYGEYLPMRPLLSALGLSRLAPGDLDLLSGPGPRTLELPGFGRAGLQICYEIIFSGHVIDRADRPDFIFNPSNDGWFGAWGPPQHLAQARLRAVEEGLPVIRATPTGISAVVDSDGRLLRSLPLGTAGVIDARLPPAEAPTLFARFGNLLPFGFALLLVAAAIAVRRKTR